MAGWSRGLSSRTTNVASSTRSTSKSCLALTAPTVRSMVAMRACDTPIALRVLAG